jgi:hypothetical protein
MIISASLYQPGSAGKKICKEPQIMSYYPQKDWINQGFRQLYAAREEKSFVKDREIC